MIPDALTALPADGTFVLKHDTRLDGRDLRRFVDAGGKIAPDGYTLFVDGPATLPMVAFISSPCRIVILPSPVGDPPRGPAREPLLVQVPTLLSLVNDQLRPAAWVADLRWISWNQHGDEEHDPDCRPVAWPPPPEVLAFWETGLGGGEGADAFCTVVAIVRAPADDAERIILSAWSPGVGDWRFNRDYGKTEPPGDRFPPPKWSVELGRWPWPKETP